MSGRDVAGSAELSRLQRAVYGPDADAGHDAMLAQERLLELQNPASPPGGVEGGAQNVLPAGGRARATGSRVLAVLAGEGDLAPAERVVWAAFGALAVALLTVGGFFLGALSAPHADRVLIPVIEADSGRLGNEDVTDVRGYTADDGMQIGAGTVDYGGEAHRCLYIGGPRADLRSEILSSFCSPQSSYGAVWLVIGDLGTGSSLFGMDAQDQITVIEAGANLEVWLRGDRP